MAKFAITISFAISSAISSKLGPTILQGPHHSAQKSTKTGFSFFKTCSSNISSVTFNVAIRFIYKLKLINLGFDVVIPVGGARLSFPGQVLGCNYSGDDSDIGHYLFLGSGDFHPIGLVLHTGKPLAMLDPYTGETREMSIESIERILRQRFGLIMSVSESKKFGILIGEKPGQMRRSLAIRMKKMLEKHGRKGYLLALEHVGPDLIDFYPVDAFVNTACPRIAIDDSVRYAKPLITPFELEVALGEKKWEHGYQFDEIP